MKYRKKPVVIEAEQYKGGVDHEDHEGCVLRAALCWASHPEQATYYVPHIHNLSKAVMVGLRDVVVRGVQGEHYLVKPDIFEATYDRVEDEPRPP